MASSKQASARVSECFEPSLWGDYFISQIPWLPTKQGHQIWMKQRVEVLITEVKEIFKSGCNGSILSEMNLIDTLQRLGVDYHFEEEIDKALQRIHNDPNDDTRDLHQAALRFRLLRQHCYDTPSDVFEEFLDGQGKFKPHIGTDVKGLLSLYEAAYLGKPGEDILDEAISFARSHLEFLLACHDLEPLIKIKILHALETPLRRRMQRLEARHHISIYEQDIATRNDMVLELAKLDFHIMQLLHQQEIRAISMWWKEFNIPAKFTFARDRIVEIYFWMLGVSFVPHCSRSRMISTKVTALLSIMDDLYDNYGTIDELQHYTNVIQRWNLEDMEQLEECYILHFQVLTTTLKEFEDELATDGLNYRVEYLKQKIKEMNHAYLVEAKWREEGFVPSFDEHLRVTQVSSGYDAVTCAYFIDMGDLVTKEALDWVTSFPQIIKSSTTIARLMDDVVSYELEKKRDHVASTLDCYMKDYGASTDEARDKLVNIIQYEWKNINKELLEVKLPIMVLMLILNLSRMMETIYKKMDGYTNSKMIKDYIMLLLVERDEI